MEGEAQEKEVNIMSAHQKITVERTYLATLQKDRKDLQKLFASGVMDWEGFEDIDWDE